MSLLGSIAGAIGLGVGGQGLGILGNVAGSWATNSAKESLNKNVMKTNLKIQKQYDEWTQQQDKAYEQWWQNYLYGLQNKEYFNLAQKYATHTARWAVEGLKAAGLNPILAGIDSNLSSSMGNANPQSSGHRVGGGSVHGASVSGGYSGTPVNLAGMMQQSSAAQLAQTETGIKKETAPSVIKAANLQPAQVAATTAESLARAKLVDAEANKTAAETAKLSVDTENAKKNAGNPNTWGQLNRLGNNMLDDGFDKAQHDIVENLTSVFEDPASAKQAAERRDLKRAEMTQIQLDEHKAARYDDTELGIIFSLNGPYGMRKEGFSGSDIEKARMLWRKNKSLYNRMSDLPQYQHLDFHHDLKRATQKNIW